MIYSINYDLKQPGREYSALYGAIKSCGGWWHYLDSTWLVDTTLDAAGIWSKLSPHLDNNDYMLIVGITSDSQGWLPKEAWDWIHQHKTIPTY